MRKESASKNAHDETSNQHTSLAQRCTVPRAHSSRKKISSGNVSLASALALAAVAAKVVRFYVTQKMHRAHAGSEEKYALVVFGDR